MRMKTTIICTLVLALSACSAPNSARKTLEDAGYSKIEITGWAPFECGKDDTFSTGFIAVNPAGKKVSGVVCSGIFKRGTIRF